jgi:hypothetical protein
MGTRRVLLLACVVLCAGPAAAQAPPWTPDPTGDSKEGGPDLVAVGIVASNGVLTLRARFALQNFDPKTTRVVWVLDTDQEPATGSPGLLGAPGVGASGVFDPVDARRIGAEAVAVLSGICNTGSLMSYDRQIMKWPLTEMLASSVLPDGFDAYVPLSSLGKIDSRISFKVLAYKFSGDCPPRFISLAVQDVAPDVGEPAAVAQEGKSELSAPQAQSPADGAVFNVFPRKTALRWSSPPGAVGYLVQVQHEDPTSPTGWRPLLLRRVPDTAIAFDFVGAQAGRWRVWAIDESGLAGPSTAWMKFRYLR